MPAIVTGVVTDPDPALTKITVDEYGNGYDAAPTASGTTTLPENKGLY